MGKGEEEFNALLSEADSEGTDGRMRKVIHMGLRNEELWGEE